MVQLRLPITVTSADTAAFKEICFLTFPFLHLQKNKKIKKRERKKEKSSNLLTIQEKRDSLSDYGNETYGLFFLPLISGNSDYR